MSERLQLVMIPGLLCTDALFAAQSADLSDVADVHIGRVLKKSSIVDMARAILDVAPPQFALAGLSLGGFVAFEILRQAPDRVSKLALLNATARADRAEQIAFREMLIGLGRTLGPRNVQAAALPMLIHKPRMVERNLVDRILNMADGVGQTAFERQQRAIIERPDNRPFLGEITCPAVVVVGDHDVLTPVKVAQEMHEAIAGSRIEIIPECGHLSTMERPDDVNRILRAWLAA